MMYKTLEEFPKYEIDAYGNIRNKISLKPKNTYVNKQGYMAVIFYLDSKRYNKKVHRLVAEYFLEPPSKELLYKCEREHHKKVLVKHEDNNKLNNHYSNLQWCDLAENTKQAWDDGLIPKPKGELNGRSTLTEGLVHKVCKFFEDGGKPKDAVIKYGISRQQATKIRAGFAWKHISELYNIKVNKRTGMFRD